MKMVNTKPGFELIFSLSLIIIMALPPMLFGQSQQKDLEITINHGDTIINGKNLKSLSGDERKQALKDIDHLTKGTDINSDFNDDHKTGRMLLKRRGGILNDNTQRIIIEDRVLNTNDSMRMSADGQRMRGDSVRHKMKFRFKDNKGLDTTMSYNFYTNPDRMGMGDRQIFFNNPGRRSMSFRRDESNRNTQNFNFSNTGSDGMTTRISIRVAEPMEETLKRIADVAKTDLELTDLTFAPEFAAGKLILMFNLPAKTAAEVKFMDSDGKMLWSERSAGGEIRKSFALGLNGVYYLQVKQAGKVALKRIVKEE